MTNDFDLIIRGNDRDIGIAEGKVAALGQSLRGRAREEIDATKTLIFPGVIDSHVHFNEPGRTDWEGFETGSRAAAAGGTTTIFEMPLNAHPPTIDGPSFDLKRAAAERSSLIDFGLWGGLVPGNLKQLETLRDRGVVGLKAFMCNSGIDDFPHVDLATLREGMRIAANLKMIVAVHAESEEVTQRLTKEKLEGDKTMVVDYLESRPIETELDAIKHAIDLAQETGCRLHIVHISCGSGVRLVAEACANGVDVTCETCPHYLLLTDRDMEKIGAAAKCAPPLRSSEDQKDLWDHLDDLTTIGSDHSPAPPDMKEEANFFKIWGGISGCQHFLSLLVNQIPQAQLASLTSTNVAQRFRIVEKGVIAVGKDADLTLVDLSQSERVTLDSLHYRHRQSPYVSRETRGRIVRTVLRGQTIYHDGKLAAQPVGRLVRPTV